MKSALLAVLVASSAACVAEPALAPDDGFDDTADGTADLGKADGSGPAVAHAFTDKALYPEGGAFDAPSGSFFVGSLGHGNITRVMASGAEAIFNRGSGEPDRLTLGMQVDAARRLLWVCTTRNSLGRIWIFDIESGLKQSDIDLAVANPKASCNDVLLSADGTALVSDRENPYIYKIDLARHVSVWANNALLKGGLVSLNSMDYTADHKYLLTAVYLPPALIRVNVANPKDVQEVDLDGDFFMDGFNLLNGPDDLVIHGDDLVVAFGSSLKRVTPHDASWSSATVKSTRTIGGVTALVTRGDKLYGINGQSVRFALHVAPKPFEIFEIDPASLR